MHVSPGTLARRLSDSDPSAKFYKPQSPIKLPTSSHSCGRLLFILLLCFSVSIVVSIYSILHTNSTSAVPSSGQSSAEILVTENHANSKHVSYSRITPIRNKLEDMTMFTLLMSMDDRVLRNSPEVYIHQYNALASWVRLVPAQNIIVFAADQYSCDHIMTKFPGMQCAMDLECVDFHHRRTDVSCVWQKARDIAKTDFLTFVNGDIILLDDFAHSVEFLKKEFNGKKFVAVGQRTDMSVPEFIDFSSVHEVEALYQKAETHGKYHGEWGLDYFVHHKEFFSNIEFPPFLAGVFRWDNWLLSQFIIDSDITVVDATLSVRAVHQDDSGRSRHWDRDGAPYNDALAKGISGKQYLIGNVYFADALIIGKCMEGVCKLSDNQDRDSDLILMFRRKDKDLNLAVLTVNTGYLEMAMNWLCWSKRIGFENYILLAEDRKSYDVFKELGAPVVIVSGAPQEKSAAEYGSREFQETMRYRTNFLYRVLSHGMNFMTADIDAVWMDNPFNYIDPQADLQGQQHKIENISGGLVYVRSTEAGINLWNAVMKCQESNIAFIMTHKPGTYTPSEYDEQYCINKLSFKMMKEGTLKRHLLKNNRFPDGRSFFNELLPQRTGVWPVIIHNNWIVGIENKIQRFKNWSLWTLDEENKCTLPKRLSYPKLTKSEVSFKIKVIAFDRPESLSRLLKSLSDARYGADSVALVVSIDYPVFNTSAEVLSKRTSSIKIAEDFEWIHGTYEVEILNDHRGLVGQWLNAWAPSGDDEILIVFEDDLEVSRSWFTWTRAAVYKYYVDPSQYDPRLYGMVLQSQHTILGESVERKYGEVHTSALLPENQLFYKYQLVGTWGTILFPKQWREFVEWQRAKIHGEGELSACVPNVYSNLWYQSRPGKIWSQWAIRFAFEKGYYMLYTNFVKQMALVVNHREAGENFSKTRGASNEMLKSLTPHELAFPDSKDLPIYDFAFNQVKADNPDILAYRHNLFPVVSPSLGSTDYEFLKDRCWIHKKYQGSVQDKQRS